MKKNETYNPYGLGDKTPVFRKYAVFSTFGAALLGLCFFLILQLLRANSAPAFLYYLVYYLSEVVSAGSLFALMALGVVAIAREETALRKGLLKRETIALFSLSFGAKLFLYWLTAVIDAKTSLPFAFNNETLSLLMAASGFRFFMSALSALFNLGLTLLTLFIVFALVRRVYNRAGQRGKILPRMKRLPVFIYLAVALFSAIVNTILTILDIGISGNLNVLINLFMPYLAIAAYALLGYFFLCRLTDFFAGE